MTPDPHPHQNPPERSPSSEAPPLWNPLGAVLWSFLFSPVFGALLQRSNWLALGREEEARRSQWWALGGALVLVLVPVSSFLIPGSLVLRWLHRLFGVAFLVAWLALDGRHQIQWIAERHGVEYPRRDWTRPLLLALAGAALYLVVLVVVSVVVAAIAIQG